MFALALLSLRQEWSPFRDRLLMVLPRSSREDADSPGERGPTDCAMHILGRRRRGPVFYFRLGATYTNATASQNVPDERGRWLVGGGRRGHRLTGRDTAEVDLEPSSTTSDNAFNVEPLDLSARPRRSSQEF